METINKLTKYISKELAVKVEKSIKKFSTEYAEANDIIDMPYLIDSFYESKLNEILDALSIKNDVINETNASNAAFLRPEELRPEKYKKLLEKKEISEFKKNNIKSSNAFKCPKCKKSKSKVTQKQIRAGDEPPTTFVECLECGYTFSFNS